MIKKNYFLLLVMEIETLWKEILMSFVSLSYLQIVESIDFKKCVISSLSIDFFFLAQFLFDFQKL